MVDEHDYELTDAEQFTEMKLIDFSGDGRDLDASPEDAAKLDQIRSSVADGNAILRQEARDHPPSIVRAYEYVYGRTPPGWPPPVGGRSVWRPERYWWKAI